MARAQKLSRYEEWLLQPQAPCAILGVDPGQLAGAALTLWTPTGHAPLWARTVKTDTLDLEACIEDACEEARSAGLVLVLAIEEWGRGGPLGIDQWLGLGAAAGAWKRAAMLAAVRHRPTLVRSRATIRIGQRSWRSKMIPEAGTRNAEGKFRAYDTEGWKKAATARVLELFGHRLGVLDANAAEAVLLAHCATRDPRIADMIPRR